MHRKYNLALQGGGSHGAFTWGVLDRLLEEGRLRIEGISGASAGSMNAAALASGYAESGVHGARRTLDDFWARIGEYSCLNPLQPGLLAELCPDKSLPLTPNMATFSTLGMFLSPYQFNPLAINPLREIIEQTIDFERLRNNSPIELFIATTAVSTGKLRIFRNRELSADVLLASACLPSLQHAVEIDGERYWDGGYSGNPPIFPLLHECSSDDVLIVLLLPLNHDTHPITAAQINSRSSEMNFSTAFLREMRAIADAKQRLSHKLITLGSLERRLRHLRIHIIEAQELLHRLGDDSRYNTRESFLEMLKQAGREHAEQWLGEHGKAIGKRSSVDVAELFC